MILRSTDGTTVELVPVGYEFGYSSAVDYHDNNWLNIRVAVSSNGATWGGVDPCLLTWELRRLCSWLKAHATDPFAADVVLSFMEPELAFEVVAREADALILGVRTLYALDRDDHQPTDQDRSIELRVTYRALEQASQELTAEAAAYPER